MHLINSKLIQIIFFSLYIIKVAQTSEDEERLIRDLFRDYNKLIRPVEMINTSVEVLFSMSLIQLINVNEKNQVMTTNVWLNLRWKDYQLKWSEADYGSISVIRLPADKVWRPDLVLFNNADGKFEQTYKSNVLIYPDGSLHWVPPAIYQSSCQIDVTYFPFDQQKCTMKFSSWTFNGDQVALQFEKGGFVDLSDYWKSGSWDIVEAPASLNRYNNTKLGHPSETDITFHITIRRKNLFYTVNLILPTLLISFLCILVFYLPVDSGEKVTLGISILLSLVVFLLLVSKILPPTSLVLPLIAKYLLFTFIMNCISILVTVIIINYNFRGPRTHKMPQWTRVIFLHYLPLLLFLPRPKRTRLQWMRDMPALSSNQQQQENEKKVKTKKDNKKENKDASQSLSNGHQTITLERRNNSVKRKDAQLTKQASTTSSLHQLHDIEQPNAGQIASHSIDSPLPPPTSSLSKQSTLQTLNVSTLPMNTGSLMQPPSFLMHNHFHTLANQHHFHHHHSPILMQTTPNSHFHHANCTLTPQTEQLHQLNTLGSLGGTNAQTLSSLHHSFGSDAHLMRSLQSDNLVNNGLLNSSAVFDPLNHLINNNNAQTDLPSHSCLPANNLNEETDDYQNENLNHLNLHNHHHHHHNHPEFSNLASLRNVNNNELNSDHCAMPRPMQTICTNELNNLVHESQSNLQQQLNATNLTASNNLNQRQISCESNSSSSFFLSPAAYKATEAIEYIAEHLRNEDEYVQIREDWKFVAMVIDRLQLYIFFFVTVFGTMTILLDAPHIFEVVNQDEVIRAHSGVS